MIPSEYCEPCSGNTTPPVTVPAPPTCFGESCTEITEDQCVRYTGPTYACLNINTNDRLDYVLDRIANALCGPTPVTPECTSASITQVNVACNSVSVFLDGGSFDTFEIRYKLASGSNWSSIITGASGQTNFTLGGLTAAAAYDIQVRRKCSSALFSSWTPRAVTTSSPTPCIVSDWSSWSLCVDGTRTRTRTILQAATCGGTACPALVETEACTVAACSIPTTLAATVL